MEQVWEKVNQFLRELRCEDVSRAAYCETEEYKGTITRKKQRYQDYLKCVQMLRDKERSGIEGYVKALEDCSDEECQKAYMQGFMDCVMLLVGAGVLKPRKEIEDIISNLK